MNPRADSFALQMKEWNTSSGIEGLLTDSGVHVPSILSTPQIPRYASTTQNVNPKIIRPLRPDSSTTEMDGGSPADLLNLDFETTPACNAELVASKETEMAAGDKPQSDQSFLDPPPLISAQPNWLVFGEPAQTTPWAAPTRFFEIEQTNTRLHWPDDLHRISHQINLEMGLDAAESDCVQTTHTDSEGLNEDYCHEIDDHDHDHEVQIVAYRRPGGRM
ncbi:hypothetical protein C8R46DRAFT_1037915 [Mycena filopes]|nr:hypothetical protein C8R46DRAFT_1037915 [Mycena filopes]